MTEDFLVQNQQKQNNKSDFEEFENAHETNINQFRD